LVGLRVVAELVGLEDTAVVAHGDGGQLAFHDGESATGVAECGAEADVVVTVAANRFFVTLAAVVVGAVDDEETKAAELVGLNEKLSRF
jgi:hypothetical protein